MSKLYVDELHPKTNGLYVKTPNRIIWKLGYDSNTQREGTLLFNHTFQLVNATYDSSTGEVTVPVDGLYLCTYMSNNDNTNKYFTLNGSATLYETHGTTNQWHNGSDSNTMVEPILCSANDKIGCYMGTDGSGTYGFNTLFTGVYLG